MTKLDEIRKRVKDYPIDWLDDENTDEEYILSKLLYAIRHLEYIYENTPNADECYRIASGALQQLRS